jgi:ABC-type transport system substrate-binding protein
VDSVWLAEFAASGSDTAIPRGFTFNLVFNSHVYPLNITAVRQAIAYLIPRANMVAAAYGGSSIKDRGGVLNEVPDGLPSYLNPLYLTPSKISSLDTYPVTRRRRPRCCSRPGSTRAAASG